MKCPYCGEEMTDGFLISSRDITFSNDDPNRLLRIKKRNDLELSKGSGGELFLIAQLVIAVVAKRL